MCLFVVQKGREPYNCCLLVFSSNSVCLCCFQDSGRSAGSLSRDFTLSRVVFSCMQTVASTPVHKAVKKPQCQTGGAKNASRSSRFQQFHEVKKKIPVTPDCVCIYWYTHDFSNSCMWLAADFNGVVFYSRLPSRSNRMNLCDRVSSAALQHGTTQPWRGPCAHVPAVLLSFAHCVIQRSTAPRRAAIPSGPSPLHRKHSSPARLEANGTSVASEHQMGKCYKNYLWNLNCFERLLKIWMFYHLPKCEVNLATFVAAAQSEKLQSSSTPKKET